MRNSSLLKLLVATSFPVFAWIAPAHAVPLVAEFLFNNTLNSDDGAPSLIATDPLLTSSFGTDTVFGNSRTVYNFTGDASPPTLQGGLTLNTTGLLTSDAAWGLRLLASRVSPPTPALLFYHRPFCTFDGPEKPFASYV